MRAGRLNCFITIQKKVLPQEKNALGQSIEKWETFKSVWAEIEPVSTTETQVVAQKRAVVTHLITIRYLPGITADMRITFSGRVFDIEPPRNVKERNKRIEIRASENV